MNVKISSRKIRNNLIAYSFIAPNFIGYLIFTLIPVACTLLLSLCEWNAGDQFWFVGLKNYQRMIRNSTFRISLSNTLYYAVATVPATMVLSLLLAKLLNMPIRGRTLFRSALFIFGSCESSALGGIYGLGNARCDTGFHMEECGILYDYLSGRPAGDSRRAV